jgi:hypothetical protein
MLLVSANSLPEHSTHYRGKEFLKFGASDDRVIDAFYRAIDVRS